MATLYTVGLDLNVTFVKQSTQAGQRMINAWLKSTKENIYQAYKKPSATKVDAFNDIEKEMKEACGHSLRMTGAGSDYFSCAYKVDNIDGDTYLIYHTPMYRYAIRL